MQYLDGFLPADAGNHAPNSYTWCYRELAQQVAESSSSLRKLYKLKVACIFGGGDRDAQAHSLAGSPDIIIATPGRLLDLAEGCSATLREALYIEHMQGVLWGDCSLNAKSKPVTVSIHGLAGVSCDKDWRPMITANTNGFHSF